MDKSADTVKLFNEEYTVQTDLTRSAVDAIEVRVDQHMQKLASSLH